MTFALLYVTQTLLQTLTDLFARYGYWAIFMGVMLENAGIPLPGETILLFAGFLAYRGKIQLVPAVLAGVAGATAGASIGFVIGYYGRKPLVERYVRKLSFASKSFDHSQLLFLKFGQWAVFGGRFIAGLRVFVGILAGLFRMPYSQFLFFTFTGALAWAIAVTYVGFMFGNNWNLVQQHLRRLNEISLIVIALAVAAGLTVYFIQRKKSTS